MREIAALAFALALVAEAPLCADEFFEGFDRAGEPPPGDGLRWSYRAELAPARTWQDLIPGDGFAHLDVDRTALANRAPGFTHWPFQTIELGPVGSNHRISIRAKNAVIPGVAGLLFTYREKAKVDEIDIEIVAHDTAEGHAPHTTGTEGGWSDIRLNTWANAQGPRLEPKRSFRSAVIGPRGEKISLRDGAFHIYTIEWKPECVRFYIDNVLQKSIDDVVPDFPSSVIFGLRQMPWAGSADWDGRQSMLVDWVAIEHIPDY